METRTRTPDPSDGIDAGAERAAPAGAVHEDDRRRAGTQIGHFRLLSVLGRGGMGVVHLAEDRKLHRRVALKLLPAEVAADPERRGRFLREARSASVVAHPNVAAVFEVGEDGGELYLAMEHVEGRTLADVIAERGGPLDLREALRVAGAVARGLAKAHETGVVHRDLKPANVMVGADGLVKILDFGVARFVETPGSAGPEHAPTENAFATVEGGVVGTPGYMAPEQSRGGTVDARADVFSFGVMLYEMVSGARPFQGATAIERIIAAARDTPAPPSSRCPAVPAAVDRLILRCLEKRPEDRFASFREIVAALDAVTPDAPPPAPVAEARGRRGGDTAMRRGGYAVMGIGVAAVAALALGVPRLLPAHAPPVAPSPSVAPASSPSVAAPASSGVALPPRRPCLDGEPGKAACDSAGVVAWCDGSGRSIACCGEGLVPVGADGICGCAPGGTSVARAIARGCAAAPADHEEAFHRAHHAAVMSAGECFRPLVDAGLGKGGEFAATYGLTPEGEVMDARVERSTVPDPKAQACALAALRATRFPPPRGEDAGHVIGFGFQLED